MAFWGIARIWPNWGVQWHLFMGQREYSFTNILWNPKLKHSLLCHISQNRHLANLIAPPKKKRQSLIMLVMQHLAQGPCSPFRKDLEYKHKHSIWTTKITRVSGRFEKRVFCSKYIQEGRAFNWLESCTCGRYIWGYRSSFALRRYCSKVGVS